MSNSVTGVHRPLCPDGRTASDAPCASPCAEHARPWVLAATILASAMAFIDGSIVTIALPVVQDDFGATFAQLQWVVNAYALMLGGLILIGGSAGDRLGRRRVFVIGIATFAVGSLGCALAPDVDALIAARAVKGVGAALLVPQSLAIIAAAFPREVRGRAIGLWAGASAITTALGPPVGGFLIDGLGWRAAFWVNLPLSTIAIGLALRYVPESRDEDATGPPDWRGGAIGVLAFGLLTLGLTRLAEPGNGLAATALPLLAGAAALALFVLAEARATNPLMPLSLFRSGAFSGANAMTLFLYGALTATLFLLPFDLIERRGMSPTGVGMALLPFGIVIGTLSRSVGGLADRVGPRLPLVAGSLLVAAATGVLAATLDGFVAGVLAPVLLMAGGMALVVAPLTTTVMNAAPDHQSGAASGVNNAASRLAGLFAVAIIGAVGNAVFLGAVEASGADGTALRFGALPAADDARRAMAEEAFLQAYRVALQVAAAWALLAALIALAATRGRSG